jgi:AraC-like DNA-binding protein
MAFVYLDPLSDDHEALRGTPLAAARARLAACSPIDRAAWTIDDLFGALGIPPRPSPDPRIAAIVRELAARPQDFPTLAAAAACVALSASRFRALFRSAVGMPFRRYRLWRRMAVVLEAAAAGASLTAAAQDAGFASSAHLSAAFREMFGMPPSGLLAAGARIERPPAAMTMSA